MAGRKQAHRVSRISLQPMLATLVDEPFDDANWLFETKWDGFRLVARIASGKVTLFSRGGKQITRDYPSIAQALSKIRHDAVLDGELVALDEKGRARFQLLQNARRRGGKLRYHVFDLMLLDGRDLRKRPLLERKRLLRAVVPWSTTVKFSRHVTRRGGAFFKNARRLGLEGIMAKRADSSYRSGRRSRDWLKVKTSKRQEAVIAGFTAPRGRRKYFGALVLAQRAGKGWRFAGHAGTGFSAADLQAIHRKLVPLIRARSPFDETLPDQDAITWVRPRIVCEVDFTEWTAGGRMRHPRFVGLRSDKPASRVVRERPSRK